MPRIVTWPLIVRLNAMAVVPAGARWPVCMTGNLTTAGARPHRYPSSPATCHLLPVTCPLPPAPILAKMTA
jgi:hypothetical protein